MKKRTKNILTYIALTIMTFVFVGPILWMFHLSIEEQVQGQAYPPVFWAKPTLQAYFAVIQGHAQYTGYGGNISPFPLPLANSLIIAGTCTLLAALLAIPAAYAFSRFTLRRAQDIQFFVLSPRFMPPIVPVIALYLVFRSVSLLDTLQSVILVETVWVIPLLVWVVKTLFDDVEVSIEEAGLLDGLSRASVLLRISIPMAIRGIIATLLLSFVFVFNDLLTPLVLTSLYSQTLPVHITGLWGTYGLAWTSIGAETILMIIPQLLIIFAAQKYIVRGLTLGTVR
jgi:multiple sugar transport system permease protein